MESLARLAFARAVPGERGAPGGRLGGGGGGCEAAGKAGNVMEYGEIEHDRSE